MKQKQRKVLSNIPFVDLLFNLLLGFVALFFLAFILINPPEQGGKIDPPVQLIVELQWPDQSVVDLDLYFDGPGLKFPVSYKAQEVAYASLEQDDTGQGSDQYTVNGEQHTVTKNYEIISVRALPDGEYFVSVHFFNFVEGDETAEIVITRMTPFERVYIGKVTLSSREERSVVSFIVSDGQIVDINTDIAFSLRTQVPETPGERSDGR